MAQPRRGGTSPEIRYWSGIEAIKAGMDSGFNLSLVTVLAAKVAMFACGLCEVD